MLSVLSVLGVEMVRRRRACWIRSTAPAFSVSGSTWSACRCRSARHHSCCAHVQLGTFRPLFFRHSPSREMQLASILIHRHDSPPSSMRIGSGKPISSAAMTYLAGRDSTSRCDGNAATAAAKRWPSRTDALTLAPASPRSRDRKALHKMRERANRGHKFVVRNQGVIRSDSSLGHFFASRHLADTSFNGRDV